MFIVDPMMNHLILTICKKELVSFYCTFFEEISTFKQITQVPNFVIFFDLQDLCS